MNYELKNNPVLGIGAIGPRRPFIHPSGVTVYLPLSMLDDPDFPLARGNPLDFDRLRSVHDFEFWAATCCTIRDKKTGRPVKLLLNSAQREVASVLENDRRRGLPMRLIMLKARQWGGSTLVQMYMAWMQCTRARNRNSFICAHTKDTSATIRGMYTDMLAYYPLELWLGEEGSKPAFRPFERSINVREITGRGCRVTIGSSERQDAARGTDFAMAHLSEVAFWPVTRTRSPELIIRSICGSINYDADTLIVMESTANGTGNYFHNEWLRCSAGRGDKHPIFIPWYRIELYTLPLRDPPDELLQRLDDYERALLDDYHLSLEQVNWYHYKRREYPSHELMMAEYPTTPTEAFVNSGSNVFSTDQVDTLRVNCIDPPEQGDMEGPVLTGEEALSTLQFSPRPGGPLSVWKPPADDAHLYNSRYLVTVDVGGRSHSSDFSVIAVFDRLGTQDSILRNTGGTGFYPAKNMDYNHLELVAQWRGHCDHDILAWKAAAIARWYGDAHLVFESNTLETDNVDGDPSLFILDQVAGAYSNLYYRAVPGSRQQRPGFHTNRSTKSSAISGLVAAVRDGRLLERDTTACGEFAAYETGPRGTLGAAEGHHDDILITRALAFAVLPTLGDPHYGGEPRNLPKKERAFPTRDNLFARPLYPNPKTARLKKLSKLY